jgi:adenylate kinase
VSLPPEEDERCDACGARLEQRPDDTEDTVRKRLVVYSEETGPVVDFYRDGGILIEIGGEGSVEEVFNRILSGLGLT